MLRVALLGCCAVDAVALGMPFETPTDNKQFFILGDFGGVAESASHKKNELAVNAAMDKSSGPNGDYQISYVINVGDSFYHYGVSSVTDSQWDDDWRNVFTGPGLQVPWISVLGNHDYGKCPLCQTQYKGDARWVMPARYYVKTLPLSPSKNVHFVNLDTNPCLSVYRSSDETGWDPKTEEWHKNILKENCVDQMKWANSTLAQLSENSSDWIVIVAHEPLYDVDLGGLLEIVAQYPIAAYLNGHTHTLETYQMTPALKTVFLTSGAGCYVDVLDEDHEDANTPHSNPHTITWHKKVAGFMAGVFNDDLSTLRVDVLDYHSTVIHSVNITNPNA